MPSKGFVLFTTMMMLVLLVLLVLSLMQAVLLYVKAGNQITKRHQAFYQLESMAHTLMPAHVLHDDQCVVRDQLPNEVIDRLKRHDGCDKKVGHHAYVYLIEDLGVFPCLRMQWHHQIRSSHHWRLTVMSKLPPYEALQLRFTTSVPMMACEGTVVEIIKGTISWRHLTE